MTYTGNLFGKIGRKFIPLKLTAEDVDRITAERDELLQWTTANGVLALVDERDGLRSQIAELNATIDQIKDQDLAVYSAAQAVVNRWDTPLWKDAPATAVFINRLRDALK